MNEIIDKNEQIIIIDDSKTVDFLSIKGESVEINLNVLSAVIEKSDLDMVLIRASEKKLI